MHENDFVNITPRESAKRIVERLQQAGFVAFWVGGCVRDFLLGRDPQDFDIATDAKPEQMEKLFKKTIPVGRKFGVVIVVENHHQFQVATFRADGGPPTSANLPTSRSRSLCHRRWRIGCWRRWRGIIFPDMVW